MSESHEDAANAQARMIKYGIGITMATTLLFAVSVYVAAAFAEPHIDAMSYRIGERVAELARANAEIENFDKAIELYDLALTKQFDDPRQRIWTLEEYAELLLDIDRLEQAATIARTAIEEAPDELRSYRLLASSLQWQGRLSEALEVQQARLATAERLGIDDVAQLAREKVDELRGKIQQ